jgi:hypothetical protein
MDKFVKENIFTNTEGELKRLPMTIFFFIISVALGIIYFGQKNWKWETQLSVWAILIAGVCGVSYFFPINTTTIFSVMLGLLGISGGMVVAQLKIDVTE